MGIAVVTHLSDVSAPTLLLRLGRFSRRCSHLQSSKRPSSHAACQQIMETAAHARQVDMANKPDEFRELYHAVIPLKDVKERVPLLVG